MSSYFAKQFIESAIKLIDNGEYYAVFRNVYNHGVAAFLEVDNILQEVGIDTEPAKLELLGDLITDDMNLHISHPEWDDGSKGWSRLQYILDSTGRLGIDFDVIVGYLLLNEKQLGLNITPLPIEYSWNGLKDYDLGWFDKDKYAEIYL